MLNAVYEVDFRGFSHGFRPGRKPHDALDAQAAGIYRKKVNWVLDADVRDFLGQLDRGWLMRFLRHRIADERSGMVLDRRLLCILLCVHPPAGLVYWLLSLRGTARSRSRTTTVPERRED